MLLSTMSPSFDFSFCGILSDTRRIVSAHSSHFLALSVIFYLPLCLLTVVEPFVQTRLSHFLALSVIYNLFSVLLSFCAGLSITHSVTNAFFGRPVKLSGSLSSLLRSFLPLLLTFLASALIYFAICTIAALVFIIGLLSLLSFLLVSEIHFTSFYFINVASSICLTYFQVNWALARAVVVVENSWGFEPLKRSSKLVQGKKLVVLCYVLLFGLGSGNGLLTWLSLPNIEGYNAWYGPWKKPVQFVIPTVLVTALRLMVAFCSLAVESVMYLHCKAVNGELAGGRRFAVNMLRRARRRKEFGGEYVTLPAEEEA